MAQNSYDLIIVGTGTAGTILAARIAQHGVHPGSGEPLRIASIEAGPYWKGAQRPGYGIPLRRQRMTNLQAGTRFHSLAFRFRQGCGRILGPLGQRGSFPFRYRLSALAERNGGGLDPG